MRNSIWMAGIAALLAMNGRAAAQTQASTILGGASPSKIVSKPIDMSNAIKPSPALAAQQTRFNFGTLFNKFTMPSFPPKKGMSAMPIPSTFPSSNYSPFKMVGKPPMLIGDPKKSAKPLSVPSPQIPMVQSPR